MMSDNFMVPDGYGGWRFPDEKPQKVTYSAGTTQHTSDTEMCSCNRSRGYDELQQRYEQLVQTLRSMWYWVRKTAYAEQGYLTVSELKEYACKFGELGVSLDD